MLAGGTCQGERARHSPSLLGFVLVHVRLLPHASKERALPPAGSVGLDLQLWNLLSLF